MTHRDRVLAALEHRRTDRYPMELSFTPEFAARLREELALVDDARPPGHPPSDVDLQRALGQDILMATVGWSNCYGQSDEPYTDEWGVEWWANKYETSYGSGYYTEVCGHPLGKAEMIDNYQPPDPNRPELYEEAQRLLDAFADEYYIVGAVPTTILETTWALRGLGELIVDFVMDPDRACRVLDFAYHYHRAAARRLVEMGVDMIWLGDDVGSPKGMAIAGDYWRQFLKPRMAELIAELKGSNANLKVAYHSDGKMGELIDDLIEIGVDVLNPVLPDCHDLADLKRRYGENLCFWGSLDEHLTLRRGTADEIRNEVRERIETLGPTGLILGTSHDVMLDTPMENFLAMVDEITSGSSPASS